MTLFSFKLYLIHLNLFELILRNFIKDAFENFNCINSIQNYQNESAINSNRSINTLDLSPLDSLLTDDIYPLDILYFFNTSQPVKELLDTMEKFTSTIVDIRANIQGFLTTNSSNKIISVLHQINVDNLELKKISICFLEQVLEPNSDKTCWNQFMTPLAASFIKNLGLFSSINQNFAIYTKQYQLDIFTLCLRERTFISCLVEDFLDVVSSVEKILNQDIKSILKKIESFFLNDYRKINFFICLTAFLIEPNTYQECVFSYSILTNKDILSKASKMVDQFSAFLGRSNLMDYISKNLKSLSQLNDVKTTLDAFLTRNFLLCLRENINKTDKIEFCSQNDTKIKYFINSNSSYSDSSNLTSCLNNNSHLLECFDSLSVSFKNTTQMMQTIFNLINKNETNLNEFWNNFINNLDQTANMINHLSMTMSPVASAPLTTTETKNNAFKPIKFYFVKSN
ncbi:hypothetical protein BpHYR1_021866 [Brachionus plicatilis]|uniref:Uncharacterized protein n=1 Tax=Brachionus plicatilis TaxID=10195 RepID=A0A3M7T405_BRAPC|nr:hypothetical protein BpHYR1_021866 [Brachionus plicatilis]